MRAPYADAYVSFRGDFNKTHRMNSNRYENLPRRSWFTPNMIPSNELPPVWAQNQQWGVSDTPSAVVSTTRKRRRRRTREEIEEDKREQARIRQQKKEERLRRKEEEKAERERLKKAAKQAIEDRRRWEREEKEKQLPDWWFVGMPTADEKLQIFQEKEEQQAQEQREWSIPTHKKLEDKIFDVLSKLNVMILENRTRNQEFEDAKIELEMLNQKYKLDVQYHREEETSDDNHSYQGLENDSLSDTECASTLFLEGVIDFEIKKAKLTQVQAANYKATALDAWFNYMDQHILRYLMQPALIVKQGHQQWGLDLSGHKRDERLVEIMRFAKHQWNLLDKMCEKSKSDAGGANVIGFLMKSSKCNCTCVAALLLLTADCLGLFPDFIRGEKLVYGFGDSEIVVTTYDGQIVEGEERRGERYQFHGRHSINTVEEFIETVG